MRSLFFNEDQTPKYRLFWLIATIIVVIWISQFLALKYYFIPNSLNNEPKDEESIWTHRGVIGDSFGAINALFSGLAFAGVIFTILLQRADIKRQHIETKEQANDFAKEIQEMQKQTEAIVTQLEEAKKQTNELTRQIRLSIMPAFAVTLNTKPLYPDSERRKETPQIAFEKYFLKITNAGNGTALNINFQPIELLKPSLNPEKVRIEFDHIDCLYHKTFVEVKHKVLINKGGNWEFYHPLNDQGDKNLMSNLHRDDQPNVLFTFKITFFDIENNEYSQEFVMEKGKSIPKPVTLVKART